LIWEVFDHVLRGWEASGDTDTSFKSAVSAMLSKLDQGLHIGSWGQIQEWKIDMDTKNDTHRHLSNLYGWYPGYSISALHGFNTTVTDAVATTLYSRGDGVADQDTGWGKVWRGACWALLNNTAEAYSELTLMIQNNIAPNGFDIYSGTFFQIDANFGLTGTVLSMLIRDIDRANTDVRPQAVLLGPAIPVAWGGGSVKNVRLRGGGSVGFGWNSQGVVTSCKLDSSGRAKQGVPQLQFFVKGGAPIKC
jgi:alpha-L-fucosidase 2